MDPVSLTMAAIGLTKLCVQIVKQIKKVVETMKNAKKGLLELLRRTERMRLYLEILRSLCSQLVDARARDITLNFNKSACQTTIEELQQLMLKIANTSESGSVWMAVNWIHYKGQVEELVQRLRDEEGEIGTLLLFISA
jgi:hypothetical protein